MLVGVAADRNLLERSLRFKVERLRLGARSMELEVVWLIFNF